MFRWVAVLAGVVGCGAVLKPPDPDRRLDVRTTGSTFESDRGWRFAVLPDPASKVVRLDLRYPVGSVDDPVGKEGLAHLVEHLLFEVTIRRGEAQTTVSAELARLALSSNAVTEEDSTTFEVTVDPAALEPVFGLLVDQMVIGCGGITPAVFDREREVVLNELREKQGPYGELQQQVLDAVYPAQHEYRRRASLESVSKLQLKDACDLLATTYQRGQAILVASGDVSERIIQDAARKHLPRVRKRLEATRAAIRHVEPQPSTTVRLRGGVDEPTLIATWALPARATAEHRLLELAWGSIPGRLEAFAFTYGWGHSSEIAVLGGAHAPVLAVSIRLSSTGQLDEAVASARKSAEFAAREIHRDGEDDLDDPRWLATREAAAEYLLARWENLAARNRLVADIFQFEKSRDLIVGRIAELQGTSGARARSVIETWLSPAKAKFLLVEPDGSISAPISTAYRGHAEDSGARVDGSLADRPLAVPRMPTLVVERFQLGNGLTVVMWPDGSAPLVQGRLVVDSGGAHDPSDKAGIAELVGASSVTPDHLVFSGRSLATRVDVLIAQLGAELRAPGLGLSDKAKAYLKARLVAPRAHERITYEQQLAAAAYGRAHPYARVGLTAQSLASISHDGAQSWARGHIVPRNAVLVLAGRFDAALVKKHVAYNLDQVGAGGDSADVAAPIRPTPSTIRGVTSTPAHTVQLDAVFAAGHGLDRDHAKRLILRGVLESKLQALRTKDAVTYGFSVGYSPRRAGGLWRISGEADTARAGVALRAFVAVLDEVRRDPEAIRAAFVLARQKVVESMLASRGSSTAVADELALAARFDVDETYRGRLVREVASATLTDFHAFVRRELAASGQVLGLFGSESALEDAVMPAR